MAGQAQGGAPKVPIGAFCLTGSSRFYQVIKAISDNAIEKILDQAGSKRTGQFRANELRSMVNSGMIHYRVSYEVHRSSSEPGFLTATGEQEIVYGYCLIVEIGNYLVVSKQNCATISSLLDDLGEVIQHDKFLRTFSEDDVEIERISLSSMNIAKMLIRKKSFEGSNIASSLPRNGAGRDLPNLVKLSHDDAQFTMNMSTGSISQKSERLMINEYIEWCCNMISRFEAAHSKNCFLPGYAQPIDFEKASRSVKPIGMLLHYDEIESRYNDGIISGFYYLNKNKKKLRPSKRAIAHGNQLLGSVFDIEPDPVGDSYIIKEKGKKIGSVKSLTSSYGLSSNVFSRIILTGPQLEESLLHFFKKYGLFSMVFSDPSYFYIYNKLFRDLGIVSEMSNFLPSIYKNHDLASTKSEKGTCSLSQTKFDEDSIFAVVENHSNLPNLVCDDMGDEWADFIEFGKHEDDYRLRFIHCKHDPETGLGASKFHIVVSQAIKNLSRLYSGIDSIKKKSGSWTGVRSGSNISIIRKSASVNILDEYVNIISNVNLVREVILYVDFISRSELEIMINEIDAGRAPRAYEIQLIWLLSTFISCCRQMNAHAKLFVAP